MRKHGLASLALVALVGGLAIHGLFVVCCGGAKPVGAQSGSCQQWAFITLTSSQVPTTSSAPGPEFAGDGGTSHTSTLAPDGWEPLTYGLGSTSAVYYFRKCVR